MPLDGPRSLRTGEMPALRDLEGRVFRPSMPAEYPQVFNESNYEGLTVCFDGPRCVSHVGMVTRSASLFGCRIELGLIGGVATDPEYRGQGLAGACVDHAFARAQRNGIDLLLVSGDRSLYLRRDCVVVGRDTLFTLTPDFGNALQAALPSLPAVRLERISADELTLLSALYRQEPVRFLRHREDYTDLYECGIVLDQLSDFFAVRTESGETRAYIISPRKAGSDGTVLVAEVGGDRHAVVAALPPLLRQYDDLSTLRLHVPRHDTLLQSLLAQAGIPGTTTPTEGTVRLANFAQLMEKLRPLWDETLGHRVASRLSFAEEGDTCIFRYQEQSLRLSRADATRLLFGTPAQEEAQLLASVEKDLAEVLRAVLPVPALWYGLSFV